MKVVVIGGSGLIGSQVVAQLRAEGHEVLAASPRTGVNSLTGEGLAQALTGAQVVVDVSNSPSFADEPVLEFFSTSTRNLLAAEEVAGVNHHVILSIVGLERLPDSGYFRAKLVQEELVVASGLGFSIVRATQFAEFVPAIAEAAVVGQELRVPEAYLQPIAASDVASEVARAATQPARGQTVEIAGPDALPFAHFVSQFMAARGDTRKVVVDSQAGYFGSRLEARALVPAGEAILGKVDFAAWLRASEGALSKGA